MYECYINSHNRDISQKDKTYIIKSSSFYKLKTNQLYASIYYELYYLYTREKALISIILLEIHIFIAIN